MKTAILSIFGAVLLSAAPQQKSPSHPLSVLCAPANTFQVGVAYNSTVAAAGGTGAYQFALTGGALPAGLSLNPSTGTVSGMPAADGAFPYTVQVTDSSGAMATTGSTPCTLQSGAPAAPKAADATPAAIAQPSVDPVKLAEPRDKAIASAAQGLPQEDHPFIIGAEDQIAVTIYGSPEFSGTHVVRPDGKITMPFLGDLTAAGLAPSELGSAVKEKLKKFIVDPDVSIQVMAINSKRFYIQGEVNKPGEYKLLVPTKVLEALVNAGGFKDFANQKKIVVMRLSGERMTFNYKEVIRGKKMEQNIYLKPGDIIIVK